MIGLRLAPILKEINDTLWEFEADNPGIRMGWTNQDLMNATKIFITIFMDRAYEHGINPDKSEEAGMILRQYLINYCGIDPHKEINKE